MARGKDLEADRRNEYNLVDSSSFESSLQTAFIEGKQRRQKDLESKNY